MQATFSQSFLPNDTCLTLQLNCVLNEAVTEACERFRRLPTFDLTCIVLQQHVLESTSLVCTESCTALFLVQHSQCVIRFTSKSYLKYYFH